MKRFPEDTKDRIEQLFAPIILKCFPYYGKFWSEFIGVRNGESERLLPYKIQFPASILQQEKDLFKVIHEIICMAHYSQFCQLAGAHFQYNEALKALKIVDSDVGYFCFWEAFENFYMHIGNARNEVAHILACLVKINPNLPTKNGKPDLTKYLKNNGRNDLVNKFKKLNDDVIKIRNNIVHYARGANILLNGKFYLRLPIEKDPLWSKQLSTPDQIQEVTLKMKKDLKTVESIINEVQQFFGTDLGNYIYSKGITFIRDK